jgi:hypothetical protein
MLLSGVAGSSRREHDDRAVVIGCDIRRRLAGEHGEGLAHRGIVAPQAGDSEPRRAVEREQPLVLALRFRIAVLGELVEAVSEDQAAAAGEAAPFRTEIVDRLAAGSRPGPAALDQLGSAGLVQTDNRRAVGDADVGARFEVGNAFGSLEPLEQLFRRDAFDQAIVAAHRPAA